MYFIHRATKQDNTILLNNYLKQERLNEYYKDIENNNLYIRDIINKINKDIG